MNALSKQIRWQRRQRAMGYCVHCGSADTHGQRMCVPCRERDRRGARLARKPQAALLREILEDQVPRRLAKLEARHAMAEMPQATAAA